MRRKKFPLWNEDLLSLFASYLFSHYYVWKRFSYRDDMKRGLGAKMAVFSKRKGKGIGLWKMDRDYNLIKPILIKITISAKRMNNWDKNWKWIFYNQNRNLKK